MKTEPELKSLAEFGVSFLRSASYYMNYEGAEDKLFNDMESAPILANLAKREMEKNFTMKSNRGPEAGYDWQWKFSCNKTFVERGYGQHENEYIALWSAIEKSGEK